MNDTVRPRLAAAVVFVAAWFALAPNAQAQSAPKGSPDHIKAVTAAIDGAAIKANGTATKDWPSYGLDYAETRFSKLNQINTDNVKTLV